MNHVSARSSGRRTTPPRLRAALVSIATGVVAVGTTVALASSASAGTTLGAAGGREGPLLRHRGRGGKLSDSVYVGILNREFNMVTAENEMKWDATEPSQGPFTYASGDQIVSHAQANGQRVRGHALAVAPAAAGLGAEPVRQRPAQRDDQPRHPGRHPLPGQDLRLGRGERGVRRRRQRRAARLEPAAHRQRLDRGGVPGRPGRRPGREALLQRLQHRRAEREVQRRLHHGAGLQGPRRADRLRRLPVALHGSRRSRRTTRPTCSASPTSASTCRSPSWTSRAPAAPRPTSTPRVTGPAWPSPAAPASPCGASGTATRGGPAATRCSSTATATRRPRTPPR